MAEDEEQLQAEVDGEDGEAGSAAETEQPEDSGQHAEDTGDEQLLSEAELDALRESTAEGDPEERLAGGLRSYDFRDPAHVLSVRLPGLESVNERLGLGFQAAVNRLMRRPVQIATADVLMSKLIDYRNSLPLPASTHCAALPGRDGVALVTLEAALVFMLVDGYYGGNGNGYGNGYSQVQRCDRCLNVAFD